MITDFEFPLNFISVKFLSKKYRGFIKGMIGADRSTFLPIIRNAIFFHELYLLLACTEAERGI